MAATKAASAHSALQDSACVSAIGTTPRPDRMPEPLVRAIATVESGRIDTVTHRVAPWPWTINVNGQGYFYQTKAQAVAAVGLLQAAGIRSIDVGCMQINLMYHPAAFATLDDAFEPQTNVTYAVRFLSTLYHQVGSWPSAAAAYHSQTPQIGIDYQKRVMALYPMATAEPVRPVEVAEAEDPVGRTPELTRLQQQMEEDHARLQQLYGPIPPEPAPASAAPSPRRLARRAAKGAVPLQNKVGALLLLANAAWLKGASRN